jgi:hypothetical protein
LCQGADESTEPARCFETILHGGADSDEGSGWHWRNALEICAGTLDANATIGCFEDAIAQGVREVMRFKAAEQASDS